jgi:M3 family oligoendopeptidase
MIVPNNFKLSELPYERPDLTSLQAEYAALTTRLANASTLDECKAGIMVWNALKTRYSTMDSIANTRFKQNVRDEAAKAEHQFFIENGPNVTEWDEEVTKIVLAHPLRSEIARVFGDLFLRRMEDASKTFRPEIKDLLVEEANLGQAYTALLAEGEIEFRGEKYNLSGIRKFAEDTDRTTRREALEAQQRYLMSVAEKMDEMYDKLVKVRHQIAVATGFQNFVEYRFTQMGRIDYTPRDVEQFRAVVRSYVVLVAQKLYKAQAERLGLIDDFCYHDEGLHFRDGNPQPMSDEQSIVKDAQVMYRALSKETGEFFDMMVERELMDLSTRPNKARGGFCTSFPMYGTPFIFSNFNGTAGDITVLTHEAGHAFQVYSSSHTQELVDYLWPTMEACEIHSFGMELFTWQWMDKFFGPKTDKFRYAHLEQALTFLPYSCAVDEFQEWVYMNPDAGAAARNAEWKRLEAEYLPWRRYNGLEFNETGRFWQTQLHIFLYPFYYIDYALAQICALQFWSRSQQGEQGFREAFADYVHICKIGGSQSFLEIVKSAKLRAPFDATCVESVVGEAAAWLERQTV